MICPNCGAEMRKGYLFDSKDGAFSFAKEVPSAFTQARTAEALWRSHGRRLEGERAWRPASVSHAEW